MADIDKLLVSFLVDEVVGGFFISVPPGHIACVYDRGQGILKKVWGPGLHLKLPFWQVAKMFNAQVVEYTIRHGFDLSMKEALGDEPLNAVTTDNKVVTVEGSILFRINKDDAPQLWENVGDNFVSKVVRPVARSRIRTVIAETSSEYLRSKREEVETKIKDELNKIFHEKGLNCEGALLSEIRVLGDRTSEPTLPAPKEEKGTVILEEKK